MASLNPIPSIELFLPMGGGNRKKKTKLKNGEETNFKLDKDEKSSDYASERLAFDPRSTSSSIRAI